MSLKGNGGRETSLSSGFLNSILMPDEIPAVRRGGAGVKVSDVTIRGWVGRLLARIPRVNYTFSYLLFSVGVR